VPDHWERGHSLEPSIISDAGDQQHIRQKRADDKRVDSLSSLPSPHELQRDIFAALVQTPNPNIYQPGFLPKAQLCRLINPERVARELAKDLSHSRTDEQIESCALTVCRETEVVHGGKTKIKSFRKIFALLVLANMASSIYLFFEEDVSDLDLPLATIRKRGIIELRRRDRLDEPSSEPLRCFNQHIWSPMGLATFEQYQWTMLAPFFSRGDCGDVKHYLLRDQHILPFVAPQLEEDDDAEFLGGFGKVFMARIHEEHHNFHDRESCTRGFAIKQLYENNRESFRKEVRILKKFSGERSHPHVVSLLATYEQFKKFHFIFYRAEGDLFRYWKQIEPSPSFNYGGIIWMAKQCAGIADGLLRLHRHLTFASISHFDTEEELPHRSTGERHVKIVNPPSSRERENLRKRSRDVERPESPTWAPGDRRSTGEQRVKPIRQPYSDEHVHDIQVEQYGRHGDINPQNILWYDDEQCDAGSLKGTLKISDFGQAELNSRFSRSRQRSVANTMTYRPPECDLNPKIIRQSYDIWCLGSVYLEFVTWMLGGRRLLIKFGKLRSTWDIFLKHDTDTFFQIVKNQDTERTEVMVKPEVTKFIDELHRHPNCTEYFHELLVMIQHDMLEVESSSRKSCQEVYQKLDAMYRQCRIDEAYAMKSNPWATTTLTAEPRMHSTKVDMEEEAEGVIAKNSSMLPIHPGRPEKKSSILAVTASPVDLQNPSKFQLSNVKKSSIRTICDLRFADASSKKAPNLLKLAKMAKSFLMKPKSYEFGPPQRPARKSLALQILSSFESSTFDARPQDYLPENCFVELVTLEAIKEELEFDGLELKYPKLDKKWQETFLKWVLEKSKKVFAITIQCDRGPLDTLKTLHRFQKSQFEDARLPIDDPRTLPQPTPDFDPNLWDNFKLYNFYERQWKCLAPVFGPNKYDYNLSSECIFPFIKGGGMPKEGAFSSVHKVKIHPAHQKHQLNEVAIKEIKINRGKDKTATDNAWELEARALEAINKLDHDHIVKCIAAIRRGDSRYFMFPWADGDSLREFWEYFPMQSPKKEIIEQTLLQLRGLADALDRLHNFDGGDHAHRVTDQGGNMEHPKAPDTRIESEVDDYVDAPNKESIRHGDLKPENILRFTGGKPRRSVTKPGLGVLKIADMGLAKRHVVATQDRSHLTSTRYGTVRYEAPETVTEVEGGRSRLYDIWSMGCITLEFIIWILYGNNELNNFYNQVKGDAQQVCQYFEIPENIEPRQAKVHEVVRSWMDHIQNTDPECAQGTESAMSDLLNIVRTKLLLVPLSPTRASSMHRGRGFALPAAGETITNYRATASEFRDCLDKILSKVNKPGYLLTGKGRENVKPPQTKLSFLSPKAAQRAAGATGQRLSPRGRQTISGVMGDAFKVGRSIYFLKGWEFPVDNAFANNVLAEVGPQALLPQSSVPAKLCGRCKGFNFWAGGFAFEDTISGLEARAEICDFCTMLLIICMKSNATKGPKMRFERTQSTLMMTGGDPLPILSIFRSPESKTPLPIQLGFPELPTPGTDTFFKIIKLWLEDCDSDANHKECQGLTPNSLPTRLIDVGTLDAPMLRLLETREDKVENDKYIALSHPWGDPEKHPPFSTLRMDDSGKGHTISNFKKAIPYDWLPATFKDAVDTTRALKIRYLWIDSLCILQGKDGDFNEQAKRMEDVFSGAYCVLAASRATGQRDGFLGSRSQRNFVTFQRGAEKPFYVCQSIDNFSRDVLEGSLNSRGWVSQERALARRTVYFTETQTYFECGSGVRCETLARMHNNMADFLGDPKFPDKAMRANSRALKISYFQDLYQQYSRLGFSRIEDRPIAIAGLEKRLQKAFHTKGGYGIFDDGPDGGLFHRSLLWQRGEDEASLTPIVFPVERNSRVPTWSWMAYKGGIDYGDPPFQTADWEKNEIRPPWTRGDNGHVDSAHQDTEMALGATVRDFTVAGRKADEVKLIYDTERTASDGQRRQCVIVARSKDGKTDKDKRHYVLIVTPTDATAARGDKIYKRVGAGFMLGKHIALDKPGTAARIY
ncbi:hypothetical protein K469DRAFT_565361, partial [Zopfia rhizophila CBS 207.26]